MVDHRHARGFDPASDGLADAAHADNADLAVAQRTDAERIILGLPQAGAQIFVGLDELAQRRDQQAHGDVGHFFGEHVWRVGDDDVVLARVGRVDMVVANAKTRDHLELRELCQLFLAGMHRMISHGDAAELLLHV